MATTSSSPTAQRSASRHARRAIGWSLGVWLIAVAAAAGWWTLGSGSGTGGIGVAAAERAPLFDGAEAIDIDAIDAVVIERGGEPSGEGEGVRLRLVREGSVWVQVEPFRAELDPFSVRQLITQTAELEALRVLSEASGERAAATLTLEASSTPSGPRRWQLICERRGVAGRALVRVGERRAVTNAALYERVVEMDPKEWRARALFPDSLGPARAIRRVTAASGGAGADGAMATIEFLREANRWRVLRPVATRADGQRMDELLTAIARARSDGFLFDMPSDLAPFGLQRPDARFEVDFGEPDALVTRSLLIGAPLGVGTADRYAMIEGIPSVIRLSAGTQSLLFPPFESLIDPMASGVRAADVKRIEIRRVGNGVNETTELLRALDRWTVTVGADAATGAAVPANGAAVDALLSALTAQRAPEMAFGEFPKDMEVATILLFGFDGRPLDVIRVARDSRTNRWGFENGDRTLRVHPASLRLPLSFDDFSREG